MTDNYYQMSFNGTQAKVYAAKASGHGIAGISIDGGAETLVDTYASTRADNALIYTSPELSPGQHTVKVRVTGTKNASSSGYTITADRMDVITPVTVNDNTTGTGNNQYQYNTTWSYGAQSGAYNNDNHWSSVTNNYYQLSFNGTQAKVFTATASNQGIAAISIDGGTETLVDTYASTRSDDVLIYTSPVLTAGQHTVKVRVTGTKNASSSANIITADRIDVIN